MTGILAIQVIEPGERADELLAAIAAKLGIDPLDSAGRQAWEYIHLPVDDYAAAVEAADGALLEAGDDGQMIVRVSRPS